MIPLKPCRTRWSRQKNMLVCSWALALSSIVLPILAAITTGNCTPEAAHRRKVFWAGGQYVFKATLNGTILVNQMYAEQLTPVNGTKHPYPLVFVHGGLLSGAVCSSYILRFSFVCWSWHCSAMAQQAWRRKRLGVLLSRPRLWGHSCRYHHRRPVSLSGVTSHSPWRDCWTGPSWFHSTRAF